MSFPQSIKDIVVLDKSNSIKDNQRNGLGAVIQAALWTIWKFRYELVFNSKKPRKDLLLDDIKLLSFLWYSNRSTSNGVWTD